MPDHMPGPGDPSEQAIADDIERRGWHVTQVREDGRRPAFAHTIGLHHSFSHPELIVFGLPDDVGEGALSAAAEAVSRGARFLAGTESDAFFDDRRCTFRAVPASLYPEYLGAAFRFYKGADVPALQVIWPDDDARWPWDVAADPWVRERQPVLSK